MRKRRKPYKTRNPVARELRQQGPRERKVRDKKKYLLNKIREKEANDATKR